ncbi:WD40 repeat domain-containing protein [Deinococcus roseus]|uniref:WD40 repeat domain-containing protein n=1 Tax=Deinococcus roseus TaxID=392414 RepID=UPI00166F5A0C|nr:hypothetical protein [Deinococcus roseus]
MKATIPLSTTHAARFAVDETHDWLVAVNVDNALDVFSLKTLKRIKQVKLPGFAQELQFSPDGKTLYVFVDETEQGSPGLLVYQTANWKPLKVIPTPPGSMDESHITPDGAFLYAVNHNNEVLRWNTHTGKMDRPWKDLSALQLAVPAKGDVGASYTGSSLYFVSLSSGKMLSRTLLNDAFAYTALSFDPAGNTLATVIDSGEVMLWNPRTFKKTAEFKTSLFYATFLNFSPDGKSILVGQDSLRKGQQGLLQIWNIETRKMVASFGNPKDSTQWGVFSKTSQTVFVKMESKIEIWSLV